MTEATDGQLRNVDGVDSSLDERDVDPPMFEMPRFWSNPGLRDPDTIIALVLANPTTVDLARTIGTYGFERVDRVRRETREELSPSEAEWLDTLWEPVVQGARDALERRP